MVTKKMPKAAKNAIGAPGVAPQVGAKRITVRLGDELDAQVQAIANDRGMSASAIMRTAVEMYLQREQFAVALSDVETNIASTLNASRRDTAKVSEDIQLLVAIMDQFMKFSMIATPEVIDKEGAVALGNRRYAGFIGDLHKAFHTRRKKAVLTQTLEGMESEQG
jgi:Arc/MetJ-type ribon-helix-helix transcriptional regulator